MSPDAERGRLDRAPASNTFDFGPQYFAAPYRGAEHQRDLDQLPRCWVCGRAPALYVGRDGRNVHSSCEPADVGLTDRPTSRAAAAKARKGTGSPLARAVLAELRSRPEGATDDELLCVFPDAPPGSVAKRRLDNVREGLVIDTGRTRATRTGRQAVVWAAVQ